MDFKDLLLKIAQNKPLKPHELDRLGQFGLETQQRNSFIAGNTTPDNQLNLNFPLMPFYSEVLEEDKSSIAIPIPGGYKHLFIMGSGRISNSGSEALYLLGRYNNDTNSNYTRNLLLQVNTSVSGATSTGTGIIVGHLTADGSDANHSGSFRCELPHYRSNLYKTTISHGGSTYASGTSNFVTRSQWNNTSIIENVTLFPDPSNATAKIAAGTAISVYGIQ